MGAVVSATGIVLIGNLTEPVRVWTASTVVYWSLYGVFLGFLFVVATGLAGRWGRTLSRLARCAQYLTNWSAWGMVAALVVSLVSLGWSDEETGDSAVSMWIAVILLVISFTGVVVFGGIRLWLTRSRAEKSS